MPKICKVSADYYIPPYQSVVGMSIAIGQLIITNQLMHLQSTAKKILEVSKDLAGGVYQLSITKPDGSIEALSATILK